jgi:uncharacterized protein (UPF0335 family)
MVNASLLKGDIESLEAFEADDLTDLHSPTCSAKVHIRQDGVIWAYYFPSYTNNIQAGIEDGDLYVSMECFYKNFGYALRLSENDTNYKLIKRDQSNAYLTAHLKAHKGSGTVVYNGTTYQIGRWLQGPSFSGQGIVSNPANTVGSKKLSIIFAEHIGDKKKKKKKKKDTTYSNVEINSNGLVDVDNLSRTDVGMFNSVPDSDREISRNLNNDEKNGYISTEGFSNKGEQTMTEAEFNQQLAKANEARDAALAQVAQLQESALMAEVDKLNNEKTELTATIEKLEADAETASTKLESVEALETQVETLTNEKAEIQAQLDEIAAETQGKDRMAKLAELAPEAYGDDDFEEIRDMSAEAFAALEKGLTKAGVSGLAKLTDQDVSGQANLTDQDVSGKTNLTEAADKSDDKKKNKEDEEEAKAADEAADAIVKSEANDDEEADVQVPAEASQEDAEANKQRGRDLVRYALRR